MEIRYLLQVLGARWRFVASVSLLAALGSLGVAFLLGERFEATTTVLIRPQQELEFSPSQKSMLDFPPSFTQAPESISQTYAGVMTSSAVATRVVELLALDQQVPEPGLAWYVRAYRWSRDSLRFVVKYAWDLVRYGRVEKRDPYWQAVDEVLSGLEAEPVEDTYLFSLTATWKDPQVAARIADTAAAVFIEYTRAARRAEDRTSMVFLGERLDEVKKQLDDTRERLRQFRASNETSSLEHQLSLKLENLAGFQAAREEAVNNAEEVRAELVTIKRLLEQEAEEVHASTTTARNPVTLELREELARDEVTLAGLRETHTSEHPTVKALVARIDEAKRRIAAETEQIRFRDTSERSPFYSDMRERLLERSARLDLLKTRSAALEETISRYRVEVQRLSDTEAEMSRLVLEIEVLENEYRLLTQEHVEARLAALQEISEIRALAAAIPPMYPSRPIKGYYFAGGLVLGFLLSLCSLLVAEYASPRIRSVDDVTHLIDAPVLAQLPPATTSGVAALLGERVSSETFIQQIAEDRR